MEVEMEDGDAFDDGNTEYRESSPDPSVEEIEAEPMRSIFPSQDTIPALSRSSSPSSSSLGDNATPPLDDIHVEIPDASKELFDDHQDGITTAEHTDVSGSQHKTAKIEIIRPKNSLLPLGTVQGCSAYVPMSVIIVDENLEGRAYHVAPDVLTNIEDFITSKIAPPLVLDNRHSSSTSQRNSSEQKKDHSSTLRGRSMKRQRHSTTA